MANGSNIKLKMTMAIAKNALKFKINNFKKQTNTIINCLIVKELVYKKIYNLRILIIVKLDIVKDVLISCQINKF